MKWEYLSLLSQLYTFIIYTSATVILHIKFPSILSQSALWSQYHTWINQHHLATCKMSYVISLKLNMFVIAQICFKLIYFWREFGVTMRGQVFSFYQPHHVIWLDCTHHLLPKLFYFSFLQPDKSTVWWEQYGSIYSIY